MGARLSYADLADRVGRAAKGFQALGVGPGVQVGLYLPNTPHYLIAFFGVLKAGGTVVNYSPLDAQETLEHKIEDSRTEIMVTLDAASLYPQAARLLASTRLRRLVVGSAVEMSPGAEAMRAHMAAAGQSVAVPRDERHVAFAALLDNDGGFRAHPVEDPSTAIAVIQYTGGTTGLPKGAMLTHRNLTVACAQYVATASGEPPPLRRGAERMLLVLPLFHIYALTANMLFGLALGAELVLHARFEPGAVIADLAAKRITIFAGVPTMFVALLDHPSIAQADLSTLAFCTSGGAPLPAAVADRFERLTGCDVAEGWGMTETSPSGTFTPVGGRRAGSCGIPVPGATIAIRSLDGADASLPPGSRGEVCIRGPNVMLGYWNDADATAAMRAADGSLRTGDVGYLDEHGYLFIVDRIKDMLLCSGHNVYPRTIEEAVARHPAVSEVCVIGVDDRYRGQAPKAYVTLKPGAPPVSLEEMRAFLHDHLGKHEMVQDLEVRAFLPKTAVGKLSKKALYDEMRSASSPDPRP